MKLIPMHALLVKVILLGMIGALCSLAGVDVLAQTQTPHKKQTNRPGGKNSSGQESALFALSSIVREGYTRPGSPSDEITKKGTVRRAAFAADYRGIGATVYFVVLERPTADEDGWGAGLTKFYKSFAPGVDFNDRHSPSLDTKARYLYLYQIVNDRGLEPVEIKRAADKNINGGSIASIMVELGVDGRYITSWGNFGESGFVIRGVDRKLDGTIAPTALGKKGNAQSAVFSVSALPSVTAELTKPLYRLDAPLIRLNQRLGLGSASNGLSNAWIVKDLRQRKGKIRLANWGKNISQPAKLAVTPDYIQLGRFDVERRFNIALGSKNGAIPEKGQMVFRADWSNKNALDLGQHSTLFGFTSNLPPGNARLLIGDSAVGKIQSRARAQKNPNARIEFVRQITPASEGDVQLVAMGGGNKGGASIAFGTGAGPTSPPPAGGGGFLGGLPPAGASGGVSGYGGIPSGFGSSGGAITSGGGGTGSGDEGSQGPGTGKESKNDISVVINNQQTQNQQQQQRQKQNQRQDGGPPGEVIPAPAALVLGLLGLPALYFVCRRKKRTNRAATD